jgi:cytochrome c oxidase assembly protein subunit 15
MSVTAAPQQPSSALRRYAWGVLGYFIAVILWGTLVRASGSGAGCGNHWPLCNGTVAQHSPTIETIIEFVHRITSGLSLLSVVGLLIWTLLGTVRTHLARAFAWASVAFTVVEAILGALLVKLGLTAQSTSPLRPWFLALHLANTLLLLAAITLTAHLLSRTQGATMATVRLAAPFSSIASLILFLAVGVTGSLAALGDTLFPASSLAWALDQDFASSGSWLIRWRWTHPTIALLAALILIWLLHRATTRPSHWDNRGISGLILLLVAIQLFLGMLDVYWLAPTWLQVAHLLGADILWSALVVLAARLTLVPLPSAS